MTIPSPQEARSRQTAMEAERHWWVQSLRTIRDSVARMVVIPTNGNIYAAGRDAGMMAVVDKLNALIDERTR